MAESHSYPDLTTPEGTLRYLSQTPFAASKVIPFPEGVSNYTYRIILKEPYSGESVVGRKAYPGLIHTMVLKHVEAHAQNSTFPLHVERQEYEALAFIRVPEITLPLPPGISLPTLYHEDRQNRVVIISDYGEESRTLKSLLRTAPPSIAVSRTIGHSLGTFLARLHTASLTCDSSSQSPGIKLKSEFSSNQQARDISATITYGRLVETLAPSPEARVLLTPPLDLPPKQLAAVASVAKEMQERIKTSDDVLTMGDFWPGNMLVTLGPDRDASDGVHVGVVDWELAKPGLAGLDVGQFLAEMVQMRTFYPSSEVSVDHIVSTFAEAYRNELTRQVVMEGVEYIVHMNDKDEEWLRTSVVGGLVG
ncbi:kinase-like domain-containing protein [Gautieria morchelliformis]|nr:kinase-like domain-containing protein [Gautieria morchelliformis]